MSVSNNIISMLAAMVMVGIIALTAWGFSALFDQAFYEAFAWCLVGAYAGRLYSDARKDLS